MLTDVHVALIGHTGKDESRGARGSNAHLADVDMMVQIAVDGDIRTATITMINDGVEGVLTQFKLKPITLGQDEDGDDITTAIVSDDRLDTEKEMSRARLNKSQRRAMELLERCVIEEGKPAPTSEYPRGVLVVPMELWQTACFKGGLSPARTKGSADKAFRRAVRDLVAMHRIGIWDGAGLDRVRMSRAPRPTGQTGTKPDKVRLCPRSNSGQTRTHPYRGVRCPEDDVVKEGWVPRPATGRAKHSDGRSQVHACLAPGALRNENAGTPCPAQLCLLRRRSASQGYACRGAPRRLRAGAVVERVWAPGLRCRHSRI